MAKKCSLEICKSCPYSEIMYDTIQMEKGYAVIFLRKENDCSRTGCSVIYTKQKNANDLHLEKCFDQKRFCGNNPSGSPQYCGDTTNETRMRYLKKRNCTVYLMDGCPYQTEHEIMQINNDSRNIK